MFSCVSLVEYYVWWFAGLLVCYCCLVCCILVVCDCCYVWRCWCWFGCCCFDYCCLVFVCVICLVAGSVGGFVVLQFGFWFDFISCYLNCFNSVVTLPVMTFAGCLVVSWFTLSCLFDYFVVCLFVSGCFVWLFVLFATLLWFLFVLLCCCIVVLNNCVRI